MLRVPTTEAPNDDLLLGLGCVQGVAKSAEAAIFGIDFTVLRTHLLARRSTERLDQRSQRGESQEINGGVSHPGVMCAVRIVHDGDQVRYGVLAPVFQLFFCVDPFGGCRLANPGGDLDVLAHLFRAEREARIEEDGTVEIELLAKDPVGLFCLFVLRTLGEVG